MRYKIALIDDSESIRDTIGYLLEDEGYDVRIYQSVEEFLTEKQGSEDVIITDYNLGHGKTGLDLIKERDTPSILMSGNLPELNEKERPSSLKAVLKKPFSIDDLTSKIHEILRGNE